jgi:large subunit ribosomal protein L32
MVAPPCRPALSVESAAGERAWNPALTPWANPTPGSRAALLACALMAVPKQKQSHARTTQRRSQHKLTAPTYNACPTCHSPRLPHRVCPVCGSYKGREVVQVDAGDQLD